MPSRSTSRTLSAIVLFGGLACTHGAAGPDDVQVTERVGALVAALRQRGTTATPTERLSPESYCLSVGARRLAVNGENVYAFEYPTPEAASRDASTVSSDGSTITGTATACTPGWTGPPRFYRQDRLIVLYVGTDQDLIRTLDAILGSPFAHR